MKKSIILLVTLFIVFSCKKQITEKTTLTDYTNIEKGLLPAVVINDSIIQTYTVKDAMIKYSVPAVSMVAFKDGEIVWTKYFGTKSSKSTDSIDENTRFQAASISKAITALGILRLVAKKKLDLDTDINQYVTSWKVESEFTATQKVTIRHLLNHTSGANVSGFYGYNKTDTIPSLLEIIEGNGNSPKVEIKSTPGAGFSYSGGGFAILQLLIEDLTGKPFETYIQEEVFMPLEMNHSAFNQFPEQNTALGHNKLGETHPEGWLIYPELSAAGLWTTPTDLAKFCIALEDSYYGRENSIISKALANEMLSTTTGYGLGIGVRGEGDESFFFHAGGNPGDYKSLFINLYKKRTGIVVMTNAGQGNKLHDDVLRSFSNFFDSTMSQPKYVNPIELTSEQISLLTGKYHYKKLGDYFLEVKTDTLNRIVLFDPNDESEVTYVPVSSTEFIAIESGGSASFIIDTVTKRVKEMNYGNAYTFQKVE